MNRLTGQTAKAEAKEVQALPARENQDGFSLLELLLVVGVGALLILAGISTYNLVNRNNRVNEATRALSTVRAEIQRAYQSQTSYGTNPIDLEALGALPSNVPIGPTGPQHQFGDDIEAQGHGNYFSVTFLNLPRDICVQLGTTINDTQSDVRGVAIDPGLDGATDVAETSGDTTVDQVVNDCSEDAPTNDIQWAFY